MTNHTKSHSNKMNQENELCLTYIIVIVLLIIAAQINSPDTHKTYNYLPPQQIDTAQRNKIYVTLSCDLLNLLALVTVIVFTYNECHLSAFPSITFVLLAQTLTDQMWSSNNLLSNDKSAKLGRLLHDIFLYSLHIKEPDVYAAFATLVCDINGLDCGTIAVPLFNMLLDAMFYQAAIYFLADYLLVPN